MHPGNEHEDAVGDLATICWMLADFWLPYLELDGEHLSPETPRRGVALIRRALQPYVCLSAIVG